MDSSVKASRLHVGACRLHGHSGTSSARPEGPARTGFGCASIPSRPLLDCAGRVRQSLQVSWGEFYCGGALDEIDRDDDSGATVVAHYYAFKSLQWANRDA